MLQSGGLMDEVTVAELVRLACDLHPKPYRPSEVLSRAGIAQIAGRKVDKLSGGQAQRVRFALATAGDSDLILLDEPTTGVDVTTRQAFWATMREQADQGRTSSSPPTNPSARRAQFSIARAAKASPRTRSATPSSTAPTTSA